MQWPQLRLDSKRTIDFADASVRKDGLRVWIGGEPGSGKSNACALLVAQWIAQQGQALIIDTHGEYGGLWSLRPGGDARVVAFGYGAQPVMELPAKYTEAQREAAVEMALDLVSHHLSMGHTVLLDLSTLVVAAPDAVSTLVGDLIRSVYAARMKTKHARHLVVLVEEAHHFFPQTQGKGDAPIIKSMTNAVSGGRKFGLHFILASQSQSLVDSNIVKLCNVRLFLRISERKDWQKVVRGYVPPSVKVTWGATTKTDITHFQAGEALLLCRWYPPARTRLNLSPVPVASFMDDDEAPAEVR